MRSTKSHTRNRRSHHALKGMSLPLCSKCSAPCKRHIICPACGFYKGVEKINILKKGLKKVAKSKKGKAGALGDDKALGAGK